MRRYQVVIRVVDQFVTEYAGEFSRLCVADDVHSQHQAHAAGGGQTGQLLLDRRGGKPRRRVEPQPLVTHDDHQAIALLELLTQARDVLNGADVVHVGTLGARQRQPVVAGSG